MSAGTRLDRQVMLAYAGRVAVQLDDPDVTRKQMIAGSLRRGAPTASDIEIVCVPAAGGTSDQNSVIQRLDDLAQRGYLAPRLNKNGVPIAWKGGRYRACVWTDPLTDARVPLDVFMTTADRWGVTLVIRTGPGSQDLPANQMLVTSRSQRGICPDDLVFAGGGLWRLPEPIADRRGLKPSDDWTFVPTFTERDVYGHLGIPAIRPPERRPEEYHFWLNIPIQRGGKAYVDDRQARPWKTVPYRALYNLRWFGDAYLQQKSKGDRDPLRLKAQLPELWAEYYRPESDFGLRYEASDHTFRDATGAVLHMPPRARTRIDKGFAMGEWPSMMESEDALYRAIPRLNAEPLIVPFSMRRVLDEGWADVAYL